MVTYSAVKASNAQIAMSLPIGIVAVFVGATSGIGEYTLKEFAKHTKAPNVYFIGRSSEAGSRIQKECQAINAEGTFTFIQKDAGLVKNVDSVCNEIKAKVNTINLLFLSTGTLDFNTETIEGLRLAIALVHYCRARFILNFLPELRAAKGLKRVVSCFTATKEGPVFADDISGYKIPFAKQRGNIYHEDAYCRFR